MKVCIPRWLLWGFQLTESIVALESREDLTYAYYNALCRLSAQQLNKIVTERSLLSLFEKLGGRSEAIDVDQPIISIPASRKGINYPRTDPNPKY
jgi:hypothetical protein